MGSLVGSGWVGWGWVSWFQFGQDLVGFVCWLVGLGLVCLFVCLLIGWLGVIVSWPGWFIRWVG